MEPITDGQLKSLPQLIFLVEDENRLQLQKWGIATHSPFAWATILGEEMGEVNKAILESEYGSGSKLQVAREAIQVATIALKIAEMYLSKTKHSFQSPGQFTSSNHVPQDQKTSSSDVKGSQKDLNLK
jgi:hypothetical protein